MKISYVEKAAEIERAFSLTVDAQQLHALLDLREGQLRGHAAWAHRMDDYPVGLLHELEAQRPCLEDRRSALLCCRRLLLLRLRRLLRRARGCCY